MSVSDKVKQLYKTTNNSAIKKNYIMNIDGIDYDNTNIVFGSFNLTEKLCSSQQLKFGECNAAMLKVKVVADIGDVSDKKINLRQEINEINIDIGVYNVDSCVLTENKKYREVVAYDNMYLFNKEVSSWYNELEFPITMKNMLISLCDYIGVELADVTLITGDKEIEKTISPEELKGITVLKSIAELNAGFFRASDVGKIELVTLNTSLIDDYLEVKDYKTLKTENYETNKITKLVIRTDKDDIGASAGNGDNAYIIEDNFLLYGSSTEKIKEFANIIYEKVKDILYVPYTAEQIGLPYLRCGSQISYRLTSGDSFVGLMLQRTLSGTQGLKDVIKSTGTKVIGSTFGIESDIIKIKNKVNTFKRTLEQTLSAVEDLERGFTSQINQTAEELELLVQKVANMGDMGVTEIVVKYAISDSATKAPVEDETGETTVWSSEAPEWVDGKYIWQKTVTTYNDGNVYESNPICITGATGAAGVDGKDGADGNDGKGISNITNYYLATSSSSGVTTSTSGWTTKVQTITSTKKYLWNYEKITYTDNTSETTTPAIIGAYGNTGATGATGADGKDGAAGADGKDGVDGKGIKSITEYYLASASSSGITTETSGWTTTIQTTTTSKKYLWNYEVISYTDGSTSTTKVRIIGTHGATGAAGKDGSDGKDGVGVKSIEEQYYQSTSSTTQTGGSWSATVPTWVNGKYRWTRSIITYTDNSTTTTTPVCVTGSKGATGASGSDGMAGVGVESVDVQYFLSTSSTSLKNGSWSTTAPAWVDGKYMWTKTVTTYTDGTTTESDPVCITGAKGETGESGANGRGIESITEYYLASASSSGVTTSTSGWTTTIQTTTTTKKYLWNYEKIIYTDGSTSTTTVKIIGTHGDTGNGLESITEEYYLSTSKTEQTGGSWSTAAPTWSSGKYIWTRSKIVYTNGDTEYTKAICDSSWEAVNDIEIGARNLLINSNYTENNKYTLTSTKDNFFKITDSKVVLEQGKEYIFSSLTDGTWGEGTVGKEYVDTVEAYLLLDGKYSTYFRLDNNTGFIFVAPATGTYYLRFDVNKNGATHSFWNFQIERGNKKSDWKPAIEDVDGLIGQNVKSIDVMYYLSTSATALTGGSWVTTAPTWENGKYIWTKTETILANGEKTETTPVCITGAKGETGAPGATGNGIESITEYYLASASSSGVTTSTGGWTTTIQTTTTTKKYLWNYEKITYTDGSTSTTKVRIIGTHGATGASGSDGLTIKSIVPQYYVSSSKTSLTGGSWSSTAPTWSKGKYVWTRSLITYSDNTTSYSTAVCDASWEVANNIEGKLELKVDKENLISELNAAADVIRLLANRLVIQSTYFTLDEEGKAELAGGKIGSWNIGEALTSEAEAYVAPGEYERDKIREYIFGNVSLTTNELTYLDLNKDGIVGSKDVLLIQKILLGVSEYVECVGAAKSTVNVGLNPTTPEKLIDMSAVTPWGVTKETYLGINGLKCPKVICDAVTATTIETAAGVNLDTVNSKIPYFRGVGIYENQNIYNVTGYITTSAQEAFLYIPMNWDPNVTDATVESLKISLRVASGGYLGGSGNFDATNLITGVTLRKLQGILQVKLTNPNGWGITNNSNFCGTATMSYTII